MLYEEGKPKSESTIVDSLMFDDFEPVNFHSGPEFRLAVNLKAGPNTSFKLSFNQMRQYLFMLSNTVTISPTDQWKLSDYYIEPQDSYQLTGGVYHIFPKAGAIHHRWSSTTNTPPILSNIRMGLILLLLH